MSILVIEPDVVTDISVRQVLERQGFNNLAIMKSAGPTGDYLKAGEQDGGANETTLVVINRNFPELVS